MVSLESLNLNSETIEEFCKADNYINDIAFGVYLFIYHHTTLMPKSDIHEFGHKWSRSTIIHVEVVSLEKWMSTPCQRRCCYGKGRDDKDTCTSLAMNPLRFNVATPRPVPDQPHEHYEWPEMRYEHSTNTLRIHFNWTTFDHVGMPIVFLHRKPHRAKNAYKNALWIARSMPNWATHTLFFKKKLCPCHNSFEHFKTVRHFLISGDDKNDIPNHQDETSVCPRICQEFANFLLL